MRDFRQRAAGDIRHAAILNIGMGNARADHDAVGFLLDLPKLLDARDVDEKIGLDQAHVEHRAQRLAAGHDFN